MVCGCVVVVVLWCGCAVQYGLMWCDGGFAIFFQWYTMEQYCFDHDWAIKVYRRSFYNCHACLANLKNTTMSNVFFLTWYINFSIFNNKLMFFIHLFILNCSVYKFYIIPNIVNIVRRGPSLFCCLLWFSYWN